MADSGTRSLTQSNTNNIYIYIYIYIYIFHSILSQNPNITNLRNKLKYFSN